MKKKGSRREADGELVLRVRVSDAGEAEIEVNREKWNDPDVWGTLLADAAITIAEGYSTKDNRMEFIRIMEKSFSRDLQDANKPPYSTRDSRGTAATRE